MSLFRKVDPGVWDDERFIELTEDAQSIWLLLLSGPQTSAVPGLQLADTYTLASVRRWPPDRVQKALDEIAARGVVQIDAKLRVIRLPNGPKYNPPDNPNVLRGWFKTWSRLPASALKYAHLASLQAATDLSQPAMLEAWRQTFATAAKPSGNGSANGSVSGSETVTHTVSDELRDSVSSEQLELSSEQLEEISAGAEVLSLFPGSGNLSSSPPEKAQGRKAARKGQPKANAKEPPIPFTVEVALRMLATASRGTIVTSPFDTAFVKGITSEIRKHSDLGQWQLVGEHAASGAYAWMSTPPDLGWIAKAGNMAKAIGQALAWQSAGRPSTRNRRANGSGHAEVADWSKVAPGAQK